MTEPTDAEIESAWTEATGSSILPYPDDMLAFARAVLAKFGTQSAVAGEPVAWLSTDCIGERYLCFTLPKDGDPARPLVFGDTAPQPAPVREPLTLEQIKDEASHHGFLGSTDQLVKFVRGIEAAHGITKGGQHGAE